MCRWFAVVCLKFPIKNNFATDVREYIYTRSKSLANNNKYKFTRGACSESRHNSQQYFYRKVQSTSQLNKINVWTEAYQTEKCYSRTSFSPNICEQTNYKNVDKKISQQFSCCISFQGVGYILEHCIKNTQEFVSILRGERFHKLFGK